MGRTITLRFAFKYVPGLIKGIESDPRLCFHLSSDLGHQIIIIDPYIEKNMVEFHIEAPESGDPFMELDAAMHIWQFASVENDSGELSCNEAGYAHVPLHSVLDNRKGVQVPLDLVVMNARNLKKGIDAKKGKLTLLVEKSSFPNGRSPFLPPSKYDVTPENQNFVVETLRNYLQSTGTIFEKKPSTYASVKYLHLPLWSFGAFSVPGCAFALPRAQPSPEKWWYNASRIALRRHYRDSSLAEAEERFLSKKTSETEVMTVVSKMHTAVVNHVATYLSDGIYVRKGSGIASPLRSDLGFDTFGQPEGAFAEDICRSVGAKPIIKRRRDPSLLIAGGAHTDRNTQFVNMEAFTLGRMRIAAYTIKGADNAGDCEDVGGEICLQAMELKTLKTEDPVLSKMRDVRQNYLILQALMGVRGAQLSDGDKRSSSDSAHAQLGGHMAAFYISKEDFLRMHAKFNKATPMYEGISAGVGERAPPLVLEGTGLVDPFGSPEYAETLDAMRYLLQGSGDAFQRIKFMQPLLRDKLNSFYREIQSFASPDLGDAFSSFELVVLKNKSGRLSTGADFLEFFNRDPTLSLYSMPNMNEDEIRVIKQILKHRFPIVGYKTPSVVVEDESHNEHLELVKTFSRSQNRNSSSYKLVDFFPRYTQVNADLARKWKHLIESKEKIVDFEYFEENLGPGVGGYMARFYVAI